MINPSGLNAFRDVPRFARLDEYFGAWAMETAAFAAYWSAMAELDFKTHAVDQARPSAVTKLPAGNGKAVAVIGVDGVMMKQRASTGGTSTVQLRRDVRAAAADPNVSAILLNIDSPGGTTAGLYDLVADVKAARRKKPVWSQVEDTGASAAYWLAASTGAVFANSPTSRVGSIGTVLAVYDQSAAAEKAGIRPMVFKTGPIKGVGTPGAAITDEQAAYLQSLVDNAQRHFDEAVMTGRGMNAERLKAVRTGGTFDAPAAKSLGLIDGIRPIEATISELSRTK